MGQTAVERIAQAHLARGPGDRSLRAGDAVAIRPRHVMTHDNTSAVMRKFRAMGASRVEDPRLPVFCLDHDIQNRSESNLGKYREIEEFARDQGVDFFPAGSGIGHQILVERLYVLPGSFVVASDSHANMYGALGAVGTPVVRTDAAALWATGEFWWQVPPTVQVRLEGSLRDGATGKDVILSLCAVYDGGEVLNRAVEFTGPGIAGLSIADRLCIANMTTEWGALVGWFPADGATRDYLRRRNAVLRSTGSPRAVDEVASFDTAAVLPDPDAVYEARIAFDLSRVSPHVSGPDTVHRAIAVTEIERRRVRIQKAFLISCVNARAEDLAAGAAALRGASVADGVAFYVAAASRDAQDEAVRSGAWGALLAAGATALPPGCGPCIGLGAGILEPGEVAIASSNRNFKGRMGAPDAQCYLASPEVVAASAVAGYIRGPAGIRGGPLPARIERREARTPDAGRVELLPGFPERVRGRLVFVSRDNLDTDGIYGRQHLFRDDLTREETAALVFENYDPRFREKVRGGDVLVAGFNFGTGSSREQALTALQSKGIPLFIAGSFAHTFLRNAFNNGAIGIDAPEFVVRLRELLARAGAASELTAVPGDDVEVDFVTSAVRYRGETFAFRPLGAVQQSLVIDGGIAAQVRRRIGSPG